MNSLETYRLALTCRLEAREEGPIVAELCGGAREVVAASDDAVVVGLEVELDDVALGSVDGVGVELLVARGCDGNRLSAGQSRERRSSEEALESKHCAVVAQDYYKTNRYVCLPDESCCVKMERAELGQVDRAEG